MNGSLGAFWDFYNSRLREGRGLKEKTKQKKNKQKTKQGLDQNLLSSNDILIASHLAFAFINKILSSMQNSPYAVTVLTLNSALPWHISLHHLAVSTAPRCT